MDKGEKEKPKSRRVPVRYIAPDGTERQVPAPEDPEPMDPQAALPEPAEGADVERPEDDPAITESTEQPQNTVGAQETNASEAAVEPLDAPAEVVEIPERAADYEERWKRAAADLENYRKRFDRELARLQGVERETILRAWLDVVDNMERALCADGASDNPWYEGMEAIHQQMLSVLRQFGCEPVVPMGEPFDPKLHEAVAAANLLDEPEGKIVDVTQTGYVLDGRVLRAPKVIVVAHGGAKG